MLRVVEIRYDAGGKSYLALQGQSDEEAHEMNHRYREQRDRMAARVFAGSYLATRELLLCAHCGDRTEREEDGATTCSGCGTILAYDDEKLKNRLDKLWKSREEEVPMASIATTERLVRQLNNRLNALTHSYDGYRDAMATGQARQEDRIFSLEKRIDRLVEMSGAVSRDNDKLRLSLQRWEQGDMRICRKYGVNEDGRVYNLQSGVEIPEDEPLFLFRAKDTHLPMVLMEYAEKCADVSHAKVINDRIAEVVAWQAKNRDAVREPDTDLSDYDGGPEPEDTMDEGLAQAKIIGPLDELRSPTPLLSVADRLDRLEKFVGREWL